MKSLGLFLFATGIGAVLFDFAHVAVGLLVPAIMALTMERDGQRVVDAETRVRRAVVTHKRRNHA